MCSARLVVSSKRAIVDRPKSLKAEIKGRYKPFSLTTTDSESQTADTRTPCSHVAPLLRAAGSVECVLKTRPSRVS